MTINFQYWPPLLTAIIGVIVLAVLGLWIATEKLSKGVRILARTTPVAFLAAPGLLAGRDGGIFVPFGVLFFPHDAFSNWHLASASITGIILAAVLWFNERNTATTTPPSPIQTHISHAWKSIIVASIASMIAAWPLLRN